MREGTFNERANAYLDEELSAVETAAFEAEMREGAELAEAVGNVRTIEAGLREVFGADAERAAQNIPDPLAMAAAENIRFPGGDSASMPRTVSTMSGWLPYAIAAALLLATLGVWFQVGSGTTHEVPSAAFIYRQAVATFEPAVVCDTPEKFLAYTEETLNEPIGADFEAASSLGIALTGWDVLGGDYNPGVSDDLPRLLYARAEDGTPIVVYFREKGHGEPALTPPPGSVATDAVSVHTKRFGGVTAYEISPLDEPIVLGLLGRE